MDEIILPYEPIYRLTLATLKLLNAISAGQEIDNEMAEAEAAVTPVLNALNADTLRLAGPLPFTVVNGGKSVAS